MHDRRIRKCLGTSEMMDEIRSGTVPFVRLHGWRTRKHIEAMI